MSIKNKVDKAMQWMLIIVAASVLVSMITFSGLSPSGFTVVGYADNGTTPWAYHSLIAAAGLCALVIGFLAWKDSAEGE